MKGAIKGLGSFSLVIALFSAFYPTLFFDFLNFDDNVYIYENDTILKGFSLDGVYWAFTTSHGGHWHPFTWVLHMVDVSLFGISPVWHRGINIGIHTINSVLLFLLLSSVTGKLGPSWVVAALFGLHPMRLESVVWISQRKDVVSLFFALLSLNFYVAWRGRGRLFRYLLSLFFFALGILAKPTIITLPLLLLVIDYWPLGRFERGKVINLVREKIPFFLLSLVSAVSTIIAQGAQGAIKESSTFALSERLGVVGANYLIYLGKFFLPTSQGIFIPYQSYPLGFEVGVLVVLITLTFYIKEKSKKKPFLLFGWLWFGITLLPMSGILQVGGQSVANRWTYLPHIGLCIAFIWVISQSLSKTVSTSIFGILIIFCFILTRQELPHWKDSTTVFKRALETAPKNFMAYTNLGAEAERRGESDSALSYYWKAIEISPSYPLPLNNIGTIYAQKGDMAKAEEFFRKALEKAPNFAPSLYNLGLVAHHYKSFVPALELIIRSLQSDPSYSPAIASLQYFLLKIETRRCIEGGRMSSDGFRNFKQLLESWNPRNELIDLKDNLLAYTLCLPG